MIDSTCIFINKFHSQSWRFSCAIYSNSLPGNRSTCVSQINRQHVESTALNDIFLSSSLSFSFPFWFHGIVERLIIWFQSRCCLEWQENEPLLFVTWMKRSLVFVSLGLVVVLTFKQFWNIPSLTTTCDVSIYIFSHFRLLCVSSFRSRIAPDNIRRHEQTCWSVHRLRSKLKTAKKPAEQSNQSSARCCV